MLNYARNIIYSPFLISIPVSIIIIILLPPFFQKLRLDVIEDSLKEQPGSIHYHKDLNGDGNTELVVCYKDPHGQLSLQVYDHLGGLAGQWNYSGKYIRFAKEAYFGDFDNNGSLEIYGFTIRNDSILLSAYEPFPGDRTTLSARYIDKIGSYGKKLDFDIHSFHITDLDQDYNKEIIFIIAGGFSLTPRKIYKYLPGNDSLVQSENFGNIFGNLTIADLDNDGFMEITGSCVACDNIPDTMQVPYKDNSSWLFILDHNLQLQTKPLEFPGVGTRIFIAPLIKGEKKYLLGFHHSIGHESDANEFLLFDGNGNLVRKKEAPEYSKKDRFDLLFELFTPDNIVIANQNGEIWTIDSSLSIINEESFAFNILSKTDTIDINSDKQSELFFRSLDGTKLIITDAGMEILATYPVADLDKYEVMGYHQQNIPYLVIQDGKRKIILQGRDQPYYLLTAGIWFLIYLGVLGFVAMIRKIQLYQIRAREKISNQILSLQLKSTSNQLDPHFTFNIFNTIASMLQKSREPAVYKTFVRFTELIRINLLSSGSITRSLEDEISFTKDYLELEKIRFEEKFNYAVETAGNVDVDIQIPKLIIQMFAENAVKHGILNKEGNGFIRIKIWQNDDTLTFSIKDNGIGRKEAAKYNQESTGLGLKMMDQYIELFRKFNKFIIKYEITDLFSEEGLPAGTKVKIILSTL